MADRARASGARQFRRVAAAASLKYSQLVLSRYLTCLPSQTRIPVLSKVARSLQLTRSCKDFDRNKPIRDWQGVNGMVKKEFAILLFLVTYMYVHSLSLPYENLFVLVNI